MHMALQLQDVILWIMFFHAKLNFERSALQGPLFNLVPVCKFWAEVAKSRAMSMMLQSIPDVALWKVKGMPSFNASQHTSLIHMAIESACSCTDYEDIIERAEDFETLQWFAPLVPKSTGLSRDTLQRDAFIKRLLYKHYGPNINEIIPLFTEKFRPSSFCKAEGFEDGPIDLQNQTDLYYAYCWYISEGIFRNNLCYLKKSDLVLPIKLALIDEHSPLKQPDWSRVCFQPLFQQYLLQPKQEQLIALFEFLPLIKNSKQHSLLEKAVLPVYVFALLSESIEFFRMTCNVGIIFQHDNNIFWSVTSSSFKGELNAIEAITKPSFVFNTNSIDYDDLERCEKIHCDWRFNIRNSHDLLVILVDQASGEEKERLNNLKDMLAMQIWE